jgi:N-carbamoyl-L-amino-acid hydrolase
VTAEWNKIWDIAPIPFDATLQDFAEEAVLEVAGVSHRLPSGPLHDAPEMQRAGVPTVMLFVQSLLGISHNKIEDTKEEHIAMSVQALDKLASRTMAWVAAQ